MDDAPNAISKDKVSATPAALKLLSEIVAEHGAVLFHQSGGCCDGSSPMCYPVGDFIIGDNDVLLGLSEMRRSISAARNTVSGNIPI